MIFVLFLVALVSFAAGILTACLLLSIKEEEMQMAQARRTWRRMESGR